MTRIHSITGIAQPGNVIKIRVLEEPPESEPFDFLVSARTETGAGVTLYGLGYYNSEAEREMRVFLYSPTECTGDLECPHCLQIGIGDFEESFS